MSWLLSLAPPTPPLPPTEWNIIYAKLAKCAESGAKVVLSRLAIGDLATQYFADRDIFCAGRVSQLLIPISCGGGLEEGASSASSLS